MLWHLHIEPAPDQSDIEAQRVSQEARDLRLSGDWSIASARGFLIEGDFEHGHLGRAAEALLVDPVVEQFRIDPCGLHLHEPQEHVIHVLPRPGVTDPEAESAHAVLRDLGLHVRACRSIRTYHISGDFPNLDRLIDRVLANPAVEQTVRGPIRFEELTHGHPYRFHRVEVPLADLDDQALLHVSRSGQLSLSLNEMRAVQAHFRDLGRPPTDCELETIAQTWSEHCSHKTLKGLVEFQDKRYDNLLRQTIFQATQDLKLDWLVSVFEDNAGIVRFDDEFDVCFKVETHNHPSAIDPYGGSNTGLGGVIRDVLGTGRAARPIANTDVFCVAPPSFPFDQLPPGVLHPRRVLEGVVAGVRDYGNRMGIPTVNGALVTDSQYLANPLVFCGTIGVLPRGADSKTVMPGDRIVALGGRTGRDGIHGATFSSVELTSTSDEVSGGSVQIGNAITEKMVLDVLLQARDRGLFRSVTDCGAGGFSSAVGEMGADLGAEVDLERAPLKYEGLSYSEIWISEAQERMVLAVPPECWTELLELCQRESVEVTDLGQFVDSGRLLLRYEGHVVCDLSMRFLHDGRPRVHRSAVDPRRPESPQNPLSDRSDFTADLLALLSDWNVASKEWIVRQYDHEVQARTVLKPLLGLKNDGPGDASVVLPVRGSTRGLAVSCGINPRLGELDPYAMAACVIDEAVRNCVAVGADPDRIALLDNFCWGNPERPETLGSLTLAAEACRDLSLAYATPFISGKDSLYNEYAHENRSLAIPGTLLISAIGIVPDVRLCVSMDLKAPGNLLVLLGETDEGLGGALWTRLQNRSGGLCPRVSNPALSRLTFQKLHQAILLGLVRSCHDLSEGGLAVSAAEMAIAGRLGAEIDLARVPRSPSASHPSSLLFSETPSRFLLEVRPDDLPALQSLLGSDIPFAPVGHVSSDRLLIRGFDHATLIDSNIESLVRAWKPSIHA